VGLAVSWFWLRKMMAWFVIVTFLNELLIPGLLYIYLHFAVMLENLWPVKTLTSVLNIEPTKVLLSLRISIRFMIMSILFLAISNSVSTWRRWESYKNET